MCFPLHPFKIEKEWEHAGLKCVVVLAREAQHRCGYVRVPPTHPAFGLNYDFVNVDVHGGLTFGQIEPCSHEDGQGYWFGFDCNHCMDSGFDPTIDINSISNPETRYLLATHKRFFRMDEGHYWTHDEVVAETERLAEQLAVEKGEQ